LDPFDRARAFVAQHPQIALWDEPTTTLLDVFSGKKLKIALPVKDVVEKRTGDTDEPYVIVLLDDERQIALAPPGIAFAPSRENVGPLPLPPVVCWRDFVNVSGQVAHLITAHPDEPPTREALDMLLYCIGLIDGARAVGFDVADEERRLETWLAEIERRKKS
jgi:hypothetical protein